MSALPPRVAEFRDGYRETISPRYSGAGHFAFTSLVAGGGMAAAICRIHHPSWAELLTVPIVFFFANLIEFLAHRGPMHHRTRGLQLIFRRHTLSHHHFFTHEAMQVESRRDFNVLLFPPILIVFFFGLVATPIGAVIFLVGTANVAYLFVATVLGYFLSYEWLHTSYHLPADSLVGRLPLMAQLRRHHQAHHDLTKMLHYNFNISFPICDWIFRTTYRPEAPNRDALDQSLPTHARR